MAMIKLTTLAGDPAYLNSNHIVSMRRHEASTLLMVLELEGFPVKETPEEIRALARYEEAEDSVAIHDIRQKMLADRQDKAVQEAMAKWAAAPCDCPACQIKRAKQAEQDRVAMQGEPQASAAASAMRAEQNPIDNEPNRPAQAAGFDPTSPYMVTAHRLDDGTFEEIERLPSTNEDKLPD